MERVPGVSHDLTPLRQWAEQCHEIFLNLSEAGFTEDQALGLIAALHNSPSPD